MKTTTKTRRAGVIFEEPSRNGAMVPKNQDEMELAIVYEAMKILSRRQQRQQQRKLESLCNITTHIHNSNGGVVNIVRVG